MLRRNYALEVSFNAIWGVSPILCVLTSFWVYTSIIGRPLTPSVAFASLAVWNELRQVSWAFLAAARIFANLLYDTIDLRSTRCPRSSFRSAQPGSARPAQLGC
jgi:hypothetical protein